MLQRVDRQAGAHAQSQLAPGGDRFADDHLTGAVKQRQLEVQQPDRASAADQYRIAGLDVQRALATQDTGEGLDQGGRGRIYFAQDRHQAALLDADRRERTYSAKAPSMVTPIAV